MPWVIEKIEHNCYAAKHGTELESTNRYDPYDFACVIEDVGNGIALVGNAVGNFNKKDKEELRKKLIDLGFTEIRWIRVVTEKLIK